MATKNRFNLIDEPWIPIVNESRVSLRGLFSNASYVALDGNPIQKIALTKLLLAIAQSACSLETEADWQTLGIDGMASRCLEYLSKWYDRFWLYGENPFLQMPAIQKAKVQTLGAVCPEISTGNTTVLTESHIEPVFTDAEKAVLIVTLMNFALGGKKTDNKTILCSGYTKGATSKPGPALSSRGAMHSFLQGESLLETLWINLFTNQEIQKIKNYTKGMGQAAWEEMPQSEHCPIAEQLKESYLGRLAPLSRFCLLVSGTNNLHYSEGLVYPNYQEGIVDPSLGVHSSEKPRIQWADPEKRPWRHLGALLAFLSPSSHNRSFVVNQIKSLMPRARSAENAAMIGVWSGGLSVSSNAGEQYVSGRGDFIESTLMLKKEYLGEGWYHALNQELSALEGLSVKLYKAIKIFLEKQSAKNQPKIAAANNLFWQLCERKAQALIEACGTGKQRDIRDIFVKCAKQVYDGVCPKNTPRQMDAWADGYVYLKHAIKEYKQ